MFENRAEAEMRLYSERLAKELALKREYEEDGEDDGDTGTPLPADEEQENADAPVATDDPQTDNPQVAP
ncbi:hypothetical protein ACQUSR_02780 [Streptomyces sp. P1-3]|uniref:hypothetical protein n=1 Tax=Streptomyces sp. P1-3 TaxID=3421658 RepID=UPI003D35CECA